MPKRRKTKKEKIIAQLKRQIQIKAIQDESPAISPYRYEADSVATAKKSDVIKPVPSDDQNLKLIKKDLLKTVILSVIFMAVIGSLYWYLELGGQELFKIPWLS